MEPDALFSVADGGGVRTAPQHAAGTDGFAAPGEDAPLPVRMRPRTIDELVGQDHLLAPGAPLRQLVTSATPLSVILWGPPGTGKTTIAHLVAQASDRRFVAMSALNAGVKDVRAVIETARRQRRAGGPPTVLFIDEVHRFSKTQQDSLLAAVEDRTVTLLAATTENPYFSVISPLLSRCVLLTLQPLDEAAVRGLVRRAVTDERGLGGQVTLSSEAEDHLVRLASGDVRKALTALEAAAGSALARGASEIDLETAEQAVDVAAVRYDRDGDEHYDVISAFIKSMRGSDVDASLHYLARMLVAGEDARFIARRIVIFASEDIGMADPTALSVATATAHAVEYVGLPEVQLNLAQAVIHMATAPKSNSATTAISAALTDVRAGKGGGVPRHLRDAHYQGAKGLGHGKGYRYPHDDPRGVVTQQYPPDGLVGVDYYQPGDHGDERAIGMRLPTIRRIVRGERSRRSEAAAANSASGSPAAAGGGADGADSVGRAKARSGHTGVADERPVGDAVATGRDGAVRDGVVRDEEGEVG
ncbi:replication-associated recombination protein A [Asanoa sp. WMMD1127]|uniref:replication-associated recombination protein A n=1 Tax=Asanoa sp. WMMD1127 TaxID=3016107 RepID=UPI002416FBDC|nr:replication-associated recombination protein A [Asanoa sp. WMMD1127]MDG4824436.1 replication-associated recombination protein A [Asanoa sp. WMMD1127]